MDMNILMSKKHYSRLLIMSIISFIAMYFLMYAMVNTSSNIFYNFNQFYMAVLMTAPMIILEISLMSFMYPNKKLNIIIISTSFVLMAMFFIFIRHQVGIRDKQFLQSMIPHHASAILMCQKASLSDPEIQELCRSIVSNQQSEIDQMKAKLKELN